MPDADTIRESMQRYVKFLCDGDVIDVMRFDEDAKVVSMRAFWNPAEMRAEP